MKNLKKIFEKKKFRYLFIIYIIIAGSLFVSANALAISVGDIQFTPQISLPTTEFQKGTAVNVGGETEIKGVFYSQSSLLPRYVGAFYQYALAIVGILAAVILMAGGILWMTSAGNESKITKAKGMIFGSLTGVALLYGSYLILATINPALIELKPIQSPSIARKDVQTAPITTCSELKTQETCVTLPYCIWKDNKCLGKIEAGVTKCSADKTEFTNEPNVQCCCQTNNNGAYVNCKWATYLGIDGPGAGPCAACGDNYADVANSDQGANYCIYQPHPEYCIGYWCNQDQAMLKYHYCVGKSNGDDCPHSGTCYDEVCWTSDFQGNNVGEANEPCGNETPTSHCLPSSCPSGYSWDQVGGRNCGPNLRCCTKD
ncbi:MAG: pilin [Candidatus Falkowbacteria bacterium]|nr:pilin [Candidatus Falkowbacteria bacterium]